MKKSLITLFLFFCTFLLSAQNQPSIEEIQSSGSYLYGVGQADEYRQAHNNALEMLISQVSVQVEGSFTSVVKEINGDIKEYCKSVINITRM